MEPKQLVEALGKVTAPSVPALHLHVAEINPANGNLIAQLAPPASGPFDPVPKLTYNSRASNQAIQFGHGWADLFNPTVTQIDGTTAEVVNGVGAAYRYTDKCRACV
jgi:hypothetical protein